MRLLKLPQYAVGLWEQTEQQFVDFPVFLFLEKLNAGWNSDEILAQVEIQLGLREISNTRWSLRIKAETWGDAWYWARWVEESLDRSPFWL